jgi:hypothetical protein
VLSALVLLRAGGLAARLALVLGGVSAAGIAVAVVPLHMGPLVLGTVLLGAAAWRAAWRAPATAARRRLLVLGTATAAFLPVWPVVLALGGCRPPAALRRSRSSAWPGRAWVACRWRPRRREASAGRGPRSRRRRSRFVGRPPGAGNGGGAVRRSSAWCSRAATLSGVSS